MCSYYQSTYVVPHFDTIRTYRLPRIYDAEFSKFRGQFENGAVTIEFLLGKRILLSFPQLLSVGSAILQEVPQCTRSGCPNHKNSKSKVLYNFIQFNKISHDNDNDYYKPRVISDY